MNSKTGLFAAAWAISCGAAFLVGRSSSEAPDADVQANSGKNFASSRSISRGEGSAAAGGKSRTRRTNSGSVSSSEDQLAAIREKIQDLKALSDPIARAQGFLDFVKNLSPDQYLDAVEAYREGGINEEQFGEYRILLTAWAQVAPLEALEYASEKTGTPLARQTILAAWAQNDTEGAVAWARDNFENEGDENRANPWMIGVIEGISSLDLGRATQLLEELPFSRGRGEALDAVFAEVKAGGNDSAKLWVASLTDEKLKEGAAARLAGQLAEEDPRGAAEWAASMGPEIMKSSAGEIVNRWADKDLPAAVDWVENQTEDIVASAGPALVRQMIDQADVASASSWLSDYEGNPAFDESVRSLVWHSMNDEPAMAADWIMKLTTEKDQTGTFHRMLGNWMRKDREGAMDYVNNNPVPESIKRRAGMTTE
ncbi:MAG: hypothetical protein ACJAVK_002415 [Akkermansiaceae bacterium]|jgi:hypothetical protein